MSVFYFDDISNWPYGSNTIKCIEVLGSKMEEIPVASNLTNDAIGCELNYHKGQKDKAWTDCVRNLSIAIAMLRKTCLTYDNTNPNTN